MKQWIFYRGIDFTGKYLIFDDGHIETADRIVNGVHHKSKILKQRNGSKGNKFGKYQMVTLWDNGKKIDVFVHRLVAQTFIPNPNNYPVVNHKDGNPSNNRVENLEWCDYSYNAIHSIEILGNNPKTWKSKAVIQKDLEGNIIKIWESAWEIQRQLGFSQVSISRCCRRQKKSGIFKGYIWDFQ